MRTVEKKRLDFKESFLHYVWKNRLFQFLNLRTEEGDPLQIIFPGYHNLDAGPDFKQAIIRIGDVKWAGDVEIHVVSSDWYKHHHEKDSKYQSVILHVVYDSDVKVNLPNGGFVSTLVLKDLISLDMFQRYEFLVDSLDVVSCRYWVGEMDSLHLQSLLSSKVMERLLRKQDQVRDHVRQCQGDWQEALFRQLAIGFGLKTNAVAFEMLSKSLPYKIVLKHVDSQLQIDALVFGQAGMLEESIEDEYYNRLQYEYDYLRYKYQLVPIELCRWNLLRLRPQNFPCVRLAQFSKLLGAFPQMMQLLLDVKDVKRLAEAFSVEADTYWTQHYHFGEGVQGVHSVRLGETAVHSLLINTVIPFLFAYYRFMGEDVQQERVLSMLEALPFENNKVTRIFKDIPFPANSALESQALIELFHQYCSPKRCVDCMVGDRFLRAVKKDES